MGISMMHFGGYKMPATSIKLLIVDDELATRTTLSQIFVNMGHSVRSAADGFSALEQIREVMPDVLLSDLNMPGMSGFELLSVVRRRLPGIYVIASSGAYTGDTIPQGIAADAFYQKATNFRSLLGLVEKAPRASERPSRGMSSDVPMWVPRSQHKGTGEAYAMICCPECLRAFEQPVPITNFLISKKECLYCKTPIHYAIVQPLDPVTSQPFGRGRNGARTPQSVAELFGDRHAESDGDERVYA